MDGWSLAKGFLMKTSSVLTLLALLVVAPTAKGASLDPNFTQTELPSYAFPNTGMAWAPDGSDRLFLTTKDGTTRIIENGALLPTPFMTVTNLYQGSECGLLAIAFDPNFGENGFVYFFVTVQVDEQRIVRYRADGNIGVEPTIIAAGLPTRGLNHDGGALAFGPDGKLYWAIGDLGVGAGVDADLTTLASKVGRVNRDGTVPTDNPFYDGAGPNEDRIWARGFRNPFSMTFRPSTGDLWLNVVGTFHEQVFKVSRGDHGGWSAYEYLQPQGFIRPIIEYQTNSPSTFAVVPTGATRSAGTATFTIGQHWLRPGAQITVAGVGDPSFDGTAFVTATDDTSVSIAQAGPDAMSGSGTVTRAYIGGCIMGGAFYDSTAGSTDYRGNFFFGDYNSGNQVRVRLAGDSVRSVETWATGGNFVDMSVGPDGDLYAVTYTGLAAYRSRFIATSQWIVVSKTNVWMVEDGVAAFNVRLSMAPATAVDVRVRRSSARSPLSVTSGALLTFGPDDWSMPKPVTIATGRDGNTRTDFDEVTVAALDLPVETVRVRIIDEYAPVEPPAGGAGGETGDAGTGGAGTDGGAGEDPGGAGPSRGGTATGGRATGGSTSGTSGTDGESGAGGETGGTGGADASGENPSDDGCGCAMSRESGSSAASLVILAALLRRRGRRRRA
jgi:MYXO-CTERM domain-containing protein